MANDSSHPGEQWIGPYLAVDGAPFVVVGAEVHNSSSSSISAITESFTAVRDLGANTVLAPVAWDLFEPAEETFDYTFIDAMITTARRLGLRLIPLWFGSWKNAASTYAPRWVKTDQARFPRAELAGGRRTEHLTPFSSASRDADARAFAALMRRIRQTDTDRTVLMVQVENEVGLLGGPRDLSAPAEEAFTAPVPAAVLDAVASDPTLVIHNDWRRAGSRRDGNWSEVFPPGDSTDEAFMAAAYASYVGAVAESGAREHDVPLYVNAWLDADSALDDPAAIAVAGGKRPGEYPSGGPVMRVAAIWEAMAPAVDLLAPDMYVDDAEPIFAGFRARQGRLFIPETRADSEGIAQMFRAVGAHRALGASPFGVDSLDPRCDAAAALRDAYRLLRAAGSLIRKNPTAAMYGFALSDKNPSAQLAFGDITFQVNTQDSWSVSTPAYPAYGLAIQDDDGVFVIGRGFWVTFSAPEGHQVSLLSADEYQSDGHEWSVTRRLNGDETASGTLVPFPFLNSQPPDRLIPTALPDAGIVRFATYTY